MKFSYLFDGPSYAPKALEADHILSAIDSLEGKIPAQEYRRAARQSSDFYVELWADAGIARKDMSFSDLQSVYRLYPTASGHLVCNELTESLWNELHAPGMTRLSSDGTAVLTQFWHGYAANCPIADAEHWLGCHHSRGLAYLRYGELGCSLGEQRLAEIGRGLLENADLLANQSNITVSQIYNISGITHDDCVKASLVLSNEPFFTVFPYGDPPQTSDREWYASIDEALAVVRSCMRQVDLSIFQNGEIPIGHAVGDTWRPETGLTPTQLQQAQDALAAFQAASMREPFNPFYDRLYFTVTNGQTPPTDIYTEFKEEALSLNIYDLPTALSAFSENRYPDGKTLYVSFGRDVSGQCNLQHVPLMSQDSDGLLYFYNSKTPGPQNSIMLPILTACLKEVFPADEMQVGKWGVKLIRPGAQYGLGDSVCNDSGDTLVEFYDRSQDPTKFPCGQFVTRYTLESLLNRDHWSHGGCIGGLSLDDAFPCWTVSRSELQPIFSWLKIKSAHPGKEQKPSLDHLMDSAEQRQQAAATNSKTHPNEKEAQAPYELQ